MLAKALVQKCLGERVAHGNAMRAQVELAQGNLAYAIRWAEANSLSIWDELRYQREREYLTPCACAHRAGAKIPNRSIPPGCIGLAGAAP